MKQSGCRERPVIWHSNYDRRETLSFDESKRERDKSMEKREREGPPGQSGEENIRLVNHWTSIRVVAASARRPSLIIDTINGHSLESLAVYKPECGTRIRVTQFTSGRSVFASVLQRTCRAIIRFLPSWCHLRTNNLRLHRRDIISLIWFRNSEIGFPGPTKKLIWTITSAVNIAISCCFAACRLCARFETRRIIPEHDNLAGVDAIFVNSFRIIKDTWACLFFQGIGVKGSRFVSLVMRKELFLAREFIFMPAESLSEYDFPSILSTSIIVVMNFQSFIYLQFHRVSVNEEYEKDNRVYSWEKLAILKNFCFKSWKIRSFGGN